MRFASLGSGSAGNALLVEYKQTRILLDCGFGLKETEQRLAKLGIEKDALSAILVTHEHDDHAGGAFKYAAKYQIPVWLTHGTYTMSERYLPKDAIPNVQVIDSHSICQIMDIEVQPFPVPHDAREPVQFVFSDGQHKLGVLTDTGTSTRHIEMTLSGCDALVLECNHDLDMLNKGPYSQALKKRVGGKLGHLDNQSSAKLLGQLDNSKLQHIIAAHLSAKNNLPNLARAALSSVLNCSEEWVGIADQHDGFTWRQLG